MVSFDFVPSFSAQAKAQTFAWCNSCFRVRLLFIGWIALLYQLPLQLFFTVWSGAFFGGLISSLHIFPRDSWAPFAFFGGLAFFGVPLVTYFGKKLNYSRTEYKFLTDRTPI